MHELEGYEQPGNDSMRKATNLQGLRRFLAGPGCIG